MAEGTIFFQGIWPGQLIAGKYRVEGAIGEGGMGIVLRAKHLDLDRVVAIKVMRPELAENPEVVERMLLEARAAAMLRSEHVARVLDIGRLESGTPYIVMEHLEGDDLYVLLARHRRLPLDQAVDFVAQACEAVAEAHARGIVHRDLKPENLFLTTSADGEPCVKVLDFGISKQRDVQREHFTNPSTALGSPNYMAPEQMRARGPVDPRADVWSLGAVLYELVTGRQPFHAEGLAAVCMSVMLDAPVPPSQRDPELPAGIDRVVLRCLEKEPEARYQSVAELASALAAFGSPAARVHAQRAWRLLYGGRPSLPEISPASSKIALGPDGRTTVSLSPATLTGPRAATRRTRRTVATAALAAGMAAMTGLVGVTRSCTQHAEASAPASQELGEELGQRAHRVEVPFLAFGTAMAIPELARARQAADRAEAPAPAPRRATAQAEPKPEPSRADPAAAPPDPERPAEQPIAD
jgi:eukaryotic-like serine/threonine-protein kinase